MVENGTDYIRHYINHRQQREKQIVAALSAGHTEVYAIVDEVYPKNLKRGLKEAAARNVRTHLYKLVAEGVVRQTEAEYSLI